MVVNIKREIGGFDFAGSRGSGEIIREKIKPILDKGESVTLDFVGVENISQSFADEVLGIFVRAFGIEYIRGKVRLVNDNQGIKDIFNFVINYSKKRSA